MPQTSNVPEPSLTTRLATVFAALLVLAFPVAGLLAKHSMTLIASMLGFGLLASAALTMRRDLKLSALSGTFAWLMAASAGFLAWSGAGIALISSDCGRCGESWLQLVGAVLVFLPLAGLGLARMAGAPAERILRALGVGLVLAGVVVLVELILDAPIYRLLSGRGNDPLIDLSRFNRGILALVLVSIPVLAWTWMRGARFIAGLAACAILGLTVLGRSEAALLTVGVALVVGVLSTVLPRVVAGLVMLGLTIGSVAAPWIAGSLQVWRVEQAVALPLSIVHRFEIWDHAAHYARLAPWSGWGFGGYRTLPIEGPHSDSYVIAEHAEAHTHNVALQLWVETGLIGLAIWLLAIGLVLRAATRLDAALRPFALAAVAAGLTPALVSFGFWQSTYLAMLAMMAFAFQLVRNARSI